MDIDDLIDSVREMISDVAIEIDLDEELYPIVSVTNSSDYNSVIDSLYMLEDTQLAKHAFVARSNELSFGELYLYFYGVLNSIYMQQQAILVILRKMGISFDANELRQCKVFDIRNSFAAHGANRGGRGETEHSFILDRHALQIGKVSGYSANHDQGDVFHDVYVSDLLSEWDKVLSKHLGFIHSKVKYNVEYVI
ncbi:hypothetical protein [Vibrio nitrifigilis]|uniref:Uncharacterized protein n=1 Tax=Vibrio nitrifigilis TaxID=2789781 RepID=A0ABS0GDR5_9VIBR|nr:hypothetical protein [Vibrio nitrifigilis]MBF9000555.1 hypothetical protein [Vibrio nitrifigilis]